MEEDIPPKRKKDWAFIFTPFLFITILLVFISLPLLMSGDFMWVQVLYLPPFMFALCGDIASRLFIYQHEERGKIIWIAQTIMMVLGFILFKVFIP